LPGSRARAILRLPGKAPCLCGPLSSNVRRHTTTGVATTAPMNTLSHACYFTAMFGATWLMCMRASDWNTDRWSAGSRYIPLVFGALGWLALFTWLGRSLYSGDASKSDGVAIALIAGLPTGVAAYALVARVRPGTAGARRMTPSEPVVVPKEGPKSRQEWLLLDVRAIPELLRRRRKRK
jgi:hypothetical protein